MGLRYKSKIVELGLLNNLTPSQYLLVQIQQLKFWKKL